MISPVDASTANSICETLTYDPDVLGVATGISLDLWHTWQGDLSIHIVACDERLVVMQRPGIIGSCAGGCPCGINDDIGSPGLVVPLSFSDAGGPDPEDGIASSGGAYGVTADDACGVGTVASFADLAAACPPGPITMEVCITDHANDDPGVVGNISIITPVPIVCGCTDPEDPNYDPLANVDDGSCGACPTVTFSAPPDLCIDAGLQTGIGGGLPVGGTYSGSGVTDDGNGLTYNFDPGVVGTGVHTITYTYADTNCCSGNASDLVGVYAIPILSFTAPADLCIDAGVQSGLGGGEPAGGIYSGAGVTDDGNGLTYSFDPQIAGLGVHSLSYTSTVDTIPPTIGDGLVAYYNFNGSADDLTANMNHGELNGPIPIMDRGGTPNSAYFFDGIDDYMEMASIPPNNFGNGESFAISLLVKAPPEQPDPDRPVADILSKWSNMFNAGYPYVIRIRTQNEATAGVINAQRYDGRCLNASVLTSTTRVDDDEWHHILFQRTDAGMVQLYIDGLLEAEAVDSLPCSVLNNASMTLGVRSGNPNEQIRHFSGGLDEIRFYGRSLNADELTFLATAELTDICTATVSDEIEVFDQPIVTLVTPPTVEIGAGIQEGLSGGTPSGGVYSGPGVIDDGNGLTYNFDPLAAGLGTHTITYDFVDENGCGSSASNEIVVIQQAVPSHAFELHQNSPNPFREETLISFHLPEDSRVTLTISDVRGKVLEIIRGDYAAGYNGITVHKSQLQGVSGILNYTIQVKLAQGTDAVNKMGEYTASRRMLLVE